MAFWLVKSESKVYSIDQLKADKVTAWEGVRNYQARNFLREMLVGELVLFYHSVDAPVGVAGVCRVRKKAYPDSTQFNSQSDYFDAAASLEAPRWYCPDLAFVEKFPAVFTLDAIRLLPGLKGMELLRRGSRLSVQPVSPAQFQLIVRVARKVSE